MIKVGVVFAYFVVEKLLFVEVGFGAADIFQQEMCKGGRDDIAILWKMDGNTRSYEIV